MKLKVNNEKTIDMRPKGRHRIFKIRKDGKHICCFSQIGDGDNLHFSKTKGIEILISNERNE